MKVTIITPVFPYPEAGVLPGIERHIQYLALSLKNLGINIQIITSFWNGGSKLDNYKGISIKRILDSKKLFGKIGSFARLNNITLGLNFIAKKNYKSFYNSNLVILAQPFGFTKFLKIKKIPVVNISYHYEEPKMFQEYFDLPFFHFLQKRQYKVHKNVVAISEFTKRSLISEYTLNENDIKVIPIGVDSERFNSSKRSTKIREKYGNEILLYVGPIIYRKRVPVLLKAMIKVIKRFPDVKLILLGDGIYLKKYQNYAKKLKINKNLIWKGFVYNPEYYYASSDIFVFPSELEGFGQVITESMACGTPVICSDIPPMSEIIENGGLTFNLNDSKDLAEKIIDLLENKEKRLLLAKNALTIVKEKYEWSIIAKEFMEYFKSLNLI